MEFPTVLSQLRREKKASQKSVAEALGISQSLLSHYENGVREPGLAFVKKACDYYGVSADFLLGRTELREETAALEDTLRHMEGKRESMASLFTAVSLMFKLFCSLGGEELAVDAAHIMRAETYKLFCYVADLGGEELAHSSSLSRDRLVAHSNVEMLLTEISFCEKLDRIKAEMETASVPSAYMETEFPELCKRLGGILESLADQTRDAVQAAERD